MPQITIYLPKELLEEVKHHAQRTGQSVSAFMTEITRQAVRPTQWPVGFRELYGSCSLAEVQDMPAESVEEL